MRKIGLLFTILTMAVLVTPIILSEPATYKKEISVNFQEKEAKNTTIAMRAIESKTANVKNKEEKEEVKGARVTKKKTSKKKYTTACLNCKNSGKAAGKTKFVIPAGTRVKVIKEKNNLGWTKISCKKGKGYVMNRYLSSKKPKKEKAVDSDEITTTTDDSIYMRDLAKETFNQVNKVRESNGLKKLNWDDSLIKVSDTRAYEASIKWSHERPDGSPWSTVSDRCQGENLAKVFTSSEDVVKGWMNSQGHRDNILRKDFTRASVSVCEINGTYYWCQSFGY